MKINYISFYKKLSVLILSLFSMNIISDNFISIGIKSNIERFKIEEGKFTNRIAIVSGDEQLIGGDAGKNILNLDFFQKRHRVNSHKISLSFSSHGKERLSIIKNITFNFNLKKAGKILHKSDNSVNIKIDYTHNNSVSAGFAGLFNLNNRFSLYCGADASFQTKESIKVNINEKKILYYDLDCLKITPCVGTRIKFNKKFGIDVGVRYLRKFSKTKCEDSETPLDFKTKHSSLYFSTSLFFKI